MDEVYPAKFSNAFGASPAVIRNDGKTLRLETRGVTFVGPDLDNLEPESPEAGRAAGFVLHPHGELCDCRIEFTLPVRVVADHHDAGRWPLRVTLDLGSPTPNGCIDREDLTLELELHGTCYRSAGRSGLFELEMLAIQSQLPDGTYIKACINCLYSDYSPLGNGLFGHMMCFRDLKHEYLAVRSKADFWKVHGRYTELVQETYLCPQFERRVPGTGYRG